MRRQVDGGRERGWRNDNDDFDGPIPKYSQRLSKSSVKVEMLVDCSYLSNLPTWPHETCYRL